MLLPAYPHLTLILLHMDSQHKVVVQAAQHSRLHQIGRGTVPTCPGTLARLRLALSFPSPASVTGRDRTAAQ